MKALERNNLPAGTVTFLFTDIEGSTQLLQQLGGEKYGELLAGQRQILRAAFEQFGGREIDTQGDSFFASFPRASDALAAVIQMQQGLAAHHWPDGVQVRVRMGLHTGEPWLVEEGYVGMDIHRAARIAHSGHGGQVLLSETTAPLVRGELPEGVSLQDLGRHRLKDMRRPERIHQLVLDSLPAKFPPLNSLEDLTAVEAQTAADGRLPRQVGPSPFRGLAAFQEADAQFFFGREAFTAELHDSLHQRQLVAVIVGSSGAGKSSAVFAGLLPQLRAEGGWMIVPIRPGGDPFHALATALLPSLEPELDETDRLRASQKLAEGLAAGEITLFHTVHRILEKSPDTHRLLLVIDQFEELYTLVPDPDLRQAFLDELLAAVAAGRGARLNPLAALLTLRADFMGQALAHRPFADALQAGSLMLGPMNREELRAAIEKPAELQGAAFEAGLVNRILDDVGEEPGNLPLLEFALTLLWDRLDQGWLTHEVYDQIGRVEGALARYADEVYAGLPRAEQAQARRAMVQLVQPGQGTEDTRRVARRADLVGVDWGLVQHLADQRLVVTGQDETGIETVEVVHEALLRGWGQLRAWMAADREFRTWQEGLRAAIRGWEGSQRDEGALLRGGPLAQAEDWLASRGEYLGETEKNYIQASVALRARRQAERERRRRLTVGGLAAGLVVAVLLSVFAFSQRSSAQRNAASAQNNAATATIAQGEALGQAATAGAEAKARATQQAIAEEQASARATQQAIAEEQARLSFSRELAAAAINNLSTDPERSILLALHALSVNHTTEAENALRLSVQKSPIRQTISTGVDRAGGLDFLSVSPDGRYVYISGAGGGSLWDLESGELIYSNSVPGEDWINHAAFSLDGLYLALPHETYDEQGNNLPGVITILDALTGQEILSFTAHDLWVQGVAFSPNGKLLATISGDRNPKIWDLEATFLERDGQLVWSLCCTEDWGNDVDFSPDGRRLVTTTGTGNADLWDVTTGEYLFTIGPDVFHVAYSPDGNHLVTESDDGLIQVWDEETGASLSRASSSDTSITNNISFSPDGSLVATSKLSGRVVVWHFSPDNIQETRTILGHSDQVRGVEFSPDGQRLFTSSFDGTIRTWDIISSDEAEIFALPASYQIRDVGLIDDGKKMITAGGDGLLRVWDTKTWEEINQFRVHKEGVNRLDVSPDGETLVTAGADGKVKIFDTTTWEEVLSIDAHFVDDSHGFFYGVMDVLFSPNGVYLLTGGIDKKVKLWDINTGKLLLNFEGNKNFVLRTAYSLDGRFVMIVNREPMIWDASTGAMLRTFITDDWLSPANQAFWSLAFSPDSSLLALGRSDGVFEVWKLPDGPWDPETQSAELLYKEKSEADFIMALRFSPDGKQIALSGLSGIAEIRDVESGELQLTLQLPGGIWEIVTTEEGNRLIAVGFDGSLQISIINAEELITLANSRVTRPLTTEECQTYLHMDECP